MFLKRVTSILMLLLPAFFIASFTGCSEQEENASGPQTPSVTRADCIGCHTDQAMLMATADPVDSEPPPSGEG